VTLTIPTLRIPARLVAPEPGWVASADVIVVGSGVAGLTAALRLRQRVDRVLLVTKTLLPEGSTQWAQGGIAAALDPADSSDEHLLDTLVAGAGVCDEEAVRVLVTEGPARVRELATLGMEFDRGPDGEISLTREGGHGRDRIAHAGGDATGKEVSRALIAALAAALAAVKEDPGIEVLEHAWSWICCRTRMLVSAGDVARHRRGSDRWRRGSPCTRCRPRHRRDRSGLFGDDEPFSGHR